MAENTPYYFVGVDGPRRHQLGSVANFGDRPASCKFAVQVSAGQHAMIEFKGSHFERDVILWAVRWYVAYPISYRQLEEMMAEHGVEVDHATLNRWVVEYVPLLEREFQTRKLPKGDVRPARQFYSLAG